MIRWGRRPEREGQLVELAGLSMGNVPWDETARIAFPMGPMGQ